MADMTVEIKKYWDRVSDSDWYKSLRTEEKLNALKEDPKTAFHPGMLALLEKYVGEFAGKNVLLPSSGDNHAAFAFAMMGAHVTSSDISERQLENAKAISDRCGLDIEYICDNTKTLSKLPDSAYDLVYTSNGTLTWIDNLNEMYANIARVLKKGGWSAAYDLHPFNRPFSGKAGKDPKIVKSYHDVFPDLHWRVQDIINSNASAELHIAEMAELPALDASFWYTFEELKTKPEKETENINDWKCNPMAALPAWIALVSQKQ